MEEVATRTADSGARSSKETHSSVGFSLLFRCNVCSIFIMNEVSVAALTRRKWCAWFCTARTCLTRPSAGPCTGSGLPGAWRSSSTRGTGRRRWAWTCRPSVIGTPRKYLSHKLVKSESHFDRSNYIRNRMSNTEIGRAKTGWGAAETGFASPISVLQVLF